MTARERGGTKSQDRAVKRKRAPPVKEPETTFGEEKPATGSVTIYTGRKGTRIGKTGESISRAEEATASAETKQVTGKTPPRVSLWKGPSPHSWSFQKESRK